MEKNEGQFILEYANKNQKIRKNIRNYGIDLVRIISMILIINHHIIYHGGPLFKTRIFSLEHKIFIFLNALCVSGVNSFGLISGYVGFHSHKFANLFYLSFTTYLYSITIPQIYKYFKPNMYNFNYTNFILDYWYFIAYFTMYFFFPLINEGIIQIKQNTMFHFTINLFLIFSFLNEILKYSQRFKSSDIFILRDGFSYSWLLILYLFGGYLGRFKIDINKKRNKYYFIKYISIVIILCVIKTQLTLNKIAKYNIRNIIINYASPTYLGISFSIIMIFSNINIKNKILIKLISFFAPLTYGIYLLHNHLLVRTYLMPYYFLWILKYKSIKIAIIEIMCSFGVFIFCAIIDYIRLCIFRLLKIKQLFVLLEKKITIMADKICSISFL
jgi:hypothetical protein